MFITLKWLSGEYTQLGPFEDADAIIKVSKVRQLVTQSLARTNQYTLVHLYNNARSLEDHNTFPILPTPMITVFVNPSPFIDMLDDVDINWYYLSLNPNPKVVDFILERYTAKIETWSPVIWWNLARHHTRFISTTEPVWSNLSSLVISNIAHALSSHTESEESDVKQAWDMFLDITERFNMPPDSYNWFTMCRNPFAVGMLKEIDTSKLNFCELCRNPNPEVLDILRHHPDRIDWSVLVAHPSPITAVFVLENIPRDHRKFLSQSGNPLILEYLQTHLDEVDWGILSRNRYALSILEAHSDSIVPSALLYNTNEQALDLYFLHFGRSHLRIDENPYPDSLYETYGSILLHNGSRRALETFAEEMEKCGWNWESVLQTHPNLVMWRLMQSLQTNPNALPIFVKIFQELHTVSGMIWSNPAIFL